MRQLRDDTHLVLDGEVRVYRRERSKRWQAAFVIDGHTIRISTGKRDLTEAKEYARDTFLEYKFRHKNDLPLRWNHPFKGTLAPGSFLDAAEETGVLDKLFDFTLRKSISAISYFKEHGLLLPRVGVNISAGYISRLDVERLIEQFPGAGNLISLEIVETSDLDNLSDRLRSKIHQLRSAGYRIEIDDFGTGHTSIVGLLGVMPDAIKIDRQLTKDITKSAQAYRLLKSVLEIAKNLEIETIAEGIETQEHLDTLREMGCDKLQGYFLAMPSPLSTAVLDAL